MDTWKIIDKLFNNDRAHLVNHHILSYNQFIKQISTIFKENNPIKILQNKDPTTHKYNLQCNLYLGGKDGSKIRFGKPIIYDDQNRSYMYPNMARLRNMTYGCTIHYDVDVEYTVGNAQTSEETVENIFLGYFPIMLQSNLCILNKLAPSACYNLENVETITAAISSSTAKKRSSCRRKNSRTTSFICATRSMTPTVIPSKYDRFRKIRQSRCAN